MQDMRTLISKWEIDAPNLTSAIPNFWHNKDLSPAENETMVKIFRGMLDNPKDVSKVVSTY